MSYRILTVACLLLIALVGPAYAAGGAVGDSFHETVLEVRDGKIFAPRAKHLPGAPSAKDYFKWGWRAEKEGDYISFDSSEVFYPAKGSLEIKVTVADMASLKALGNYLESLVTLYDVAGVAFFALGINDHDVEVGSYPLHAMVMESVFGGVGFPYVELLDGPLKEGMQFTITVRWGTTPASNRVYVNGKRVELEVVKGPRHHGKPPGFEPTEMFSKYMNGFETWDKRKVGPVKLLVIGRMGHPDPKDPFVMYPPRSVAINSVTLSDRE